VTSHGVRRERKASVWIGCTKCELVRGEFAKQDSASARESRTHWRVDPHAQRRIERATVRCRRGIDRGKDILERQWNAVQRASVEAGRKLVVD
jgi:hypothetical protein